VGNLGGWVPVARGFRRRLVARTLGAATTGHHSFEWDSSKFGTDTNLTFRVTATSGATTLVEALIVPVTSSATVGAALPIPRRLVALSQKRLASWASVDPGPPKMTRPVTGAMAGSWRLCPRRCP